MNLDDLETMKLIIDIYNGLKTLTPEEIENWRTVCLNVINGDDEAEFINITADLAGRAGKIC